MLSWSNIKNKPLRRDIQPTIGMNRILQIVPVLDTAIYADEDVLFATAEIFAIDEIAGPSSNNGTAPAFIRNGGQLIIQSLTVIDFDKEAAAIDLWLLKAASSIGTLNGAEGISDANAVNILWQQSITSYTALANCSFAKVDNIGKLLHAAPDSDSLYIAGVSQGTPTYTAATDLLIRIECVAS